MDKLPFIPNQVYNRRADIHAKYGGNWQSGICPSANHPYIFIFSGAQGKQHGYKDGWDNPNVFSYTGEGQAGDMKFIKGNLALRDHLKNHRRVFLFEYERSGYVRFKSELEFYDADYFETHDTQKKTRTAIRFFFTRKGIHLPIVEMRAGVNVNDTDADDILFYIKALNYGTERLKEFPFTLRFMKELHKELMTGARSSHFADPGEFRVTQNWLGGSNLKNASFIPPPPAAMNNALSDLENFIHHKELMPVLQAGILHAHFETIHPFLDGNGRTGRLLITLFLYERAVLEKPVLFLSSFFKKNQQLYYDKLNAYHHNKTNEWLHFFLDGVIETATQSIEASKKITALREMDMRKIQALGKREATSGVSFLQQLFKSPVVTISTAVKLMGYSRVGAGKLIDRFVGLDILKPFDENTKYGKTYTYKRYIDIFND